MSDEQICEICDNRLTVQWSDTHGIAACTRCGAPYRIYHYEGDKRVERPPEIILSESGKVLAHRYWKEKKRRVFPGLNDCGFLGGRHTTYSGATHDDIDAWNAWYDRQPEASAS